MITRKQRLREQAGVKHRRYPTSVFKVGDDVAYSVQFLRSIFASYTAMSFGRGKIVSLEQVTDGLVLAVINWGGSDLPERVNITNLARVGLNGRFCNVD